VHLQATAQFNVSYGKNQDTYDVRGRVTQECIFNLNDGAFRCRSAQQGYSPYTTWTRGLAWAVCGFAEQLEFLDTIPASDFPATETQGQNEPDFRSKRQVIKKLVDCATAAADFYLAHSCTDGIPMWDTGAPDLHRLGDYLSEPADPFNPWEPVDSSAAAITAQGLIRLGNYFSTKADKKSAARYRQAGLTIAKTLLNEPYLSIEPKHQGLLLHSVYHRPNGWDYVAPGQKVPNGESSMWGDYHLRELALLLLRETRNESYLKFFADSKPSV
ncbi:MAG TPA: glycosyl hydrolase, partial [Clostridia bacterium]|nr:glycosyl hydrolase [Clostridia bacterium]